jgi:hypothetical protein
VLRWGSGWGTKEASVAKADVPVRVLLEDFGYKLNYKESSSRDTKENEGITWALLSKKDI